MRTYNFRNTGCICSFLWLCVDSPSLTAAGCCCVGSRFGDLERRSCSQNQTTPDCVDWYSTSTGQQPRCARRRSNSRRSLTSCAIRRNPSAPTHYSHHHSPRLHLLITTPIAPLRQFLHRTPPYLYSVCFGKGYFLTNRPAPDQLSC